MHDELRAYHQIFERELRGDILAYWMRYSVDAEGGGFYGAVDLDNQPVAGAERACVLTARILWTFAAAARRYPGQGYEAMAERAYGVLMTHFHDPLHGGFYMLLHADHSPADTTKHTYAQAFVLYALCQYAGLHKGAGLHKDAGLNTNAMLLTQIQAFYALLEARTKAPDRPGYGEAFQRDWQPLAVNRMADDNEPRSMNTHLHVLEAYAALYHLWPDPGVGRRLGELLTLFLERIIRPSGHLGIFFDLDFNETPASAAICSFGHDIEASWLLWEAAQCLGDDDILRRMRPAALRMLDAVIRVGLDVDGGLFLESTRFGSHVRTNKHWWLQAETLVGLMNGYELSGDGRYWELLKRSWGFIDQYVLDHQGGEWFTKVNRLGQPYRSEPPNDPSPYYRNDWKIDPWKCPYHNGRACLELMLRIERLLK